MARVKIQPPLSYPFFTTIPVRVTDINYGGHVGNDAIVSLVHEARMQYLSHHGLTELQFRGVGLIMADLAVEFKSESFYGDKITVGVACIEFTRVGFDIMYKLSKEGAGKEIIVALAKTGMICYDYNLKKVSSLPTGIKELLGG
jgi:acyl-CoA thioesterase FadM